MTVNIDWGLGTGAPDPGAMVQQGYELGQKQRDQTNLRRALGILSADPTDPAARATAMALDPQILGSIDNAAWARQAHQQAEDYRSGLRDRVLAGIAPASTAPALSAPSAPPQPSGAMAALLGGPAPRPQPIPDGSEFGHVDVAAPVAPAQPAVNVAGTSPTLAALTGPDAGFAGVAASPAAPASALPDLPAATVAAAQPAAAPAPDPQSARDAAFARMVKADPERAAALMETERAQRVAQRTAQLEFAEKVNAHGLQLLATAHDQPSYDAAVASYNAMLTANGLPAASLPPTYSAETVHGLQLQALDVKDQIAAAKDAATLAETSRHNRADEDKTKFAPIKVKNSSGGEDVYIYDQASGKFVNSGSGGSDGEGGGSGGGAGAAVSPKAAAVASTLAGGGMSAPVVAGFMGNFSAEGGWSGAKGDGGSASGIAQLRGGRLQNFVQMFGKDPSEASPEDQAKFVLWEMQHPTAAGMTVAQRDAILAAKTPGQAAALIDRYYERSDGTARQYRIQSANAFASASAKSGGGEDDESPPSKGGLPAHPAIHTDGPKNGGLGPDEIHFFAQDVANGGDMPQLGMGKDAAVARQAILKEVARIRTGQGGDGTDYGTRRAESKAAKQALQALEKQAAPVLAFERTAKMNGDVALGLSSANGNGQVPIFNRWVNAGKTAVTGDPDVTRFHAAVETFANEFAKLTSSATGGGVTSDSARQHVYDMINRDQSPAQFKGTMQVLYRDMENRRVGLAQQRQELLKTIQGGPARQAPASGGAGNVPTLTPDQVRAAPSGTVFRTTDGRTMRKR